MLMYLRTAFYNQIAILIWYFYAKESKQNSGLGWAPVEPVCHSGYLIQYFETSSAGTCCEP